MHTADTYMYTPRDDRQDFHILHTAQPAFRGNRSGGGTGGELALAPIRRRTQPERRVLARTRACGFQTVEGPLHKKIYLRTEKEHRAHIAAQRNHSARRRRGDSDRERAQILRTDRSERRGSVMDSRRRDYNQRTDGNPAHAGTEKRHQRERSVPAHGGRHAGIGRRGGVGHGYKHDRMVRDRPDCVYRNSLGNTRVDMAPAIGKPQTVSRRHTGRHRHRGDREDDKGQIQRQGRAPHTHLGHKHHYKRTDGTRRNKRHQCHGADENRHKKSPCRSRDNPHHTRIRDRRLPLQRLLRTHARGHKESTGHRKTHN